MGGARSVWRSRAPLSSSGTGASRAPRQQAARAQALGSLDYGADEVRQVPRGSAAGPLRVFTPVAEAAAPAAAASSSSASTVTAFIEPAAAAAGGFPAHGFPVTMEMVSAPVAADMDTCRQNLLNVVGERHPMLLAAANQIFSAGGKRLRPLLVLLVARATYPITGLR